MFIGNNFFPNAKDYLPNKVEITQPKGLVVRFKYFNNANHVHYILT